MLTRGAWPCFCLVCLFPKQLAWYRLGDKFPSCPLGPRARPACAGVFTALLRKTSCSEAFGPEKAEGTVFLRPLLRKGVLRLPSRFSFL